MVVQIQSGQSASDARSVSGATVPARVARLPVLPTIQEVSAASSGCPRGLPADRSKARNAGSAVHPGPAFGWDSPKSNTGLAGIHRRATLAWLGCRRAELTCLVTEGRGTPGAVFLVIPVVPVFPIAPDPQGSDQFGLVPFCRLFRLFRFIRSHQTPRGGRFLRLLRFSGHPGWSAFPPSAQIEAISPIQFGWSSPGVFRKGGG